MTKDPTSEFASPSAAALGRDAASVGVGAPFPGKTFFGHPRGLATLFFTELWERFSYYGMRALLILFMTATIAEEGLGFEAATAGAIYGLYTAFVYLMALPGGWVADRIMGQRRAVLIGGIVIALGHFSMAFRGISTFYLGLGLIVIGTGLLKPNISTMVGELYPEGGARRDAGFSIFYMGINIGALVAPLVCGLVAQQFGWHWGFATAGFGMVVGVIVYLATGKNLGDAGLYPNAARRGTEEDAPRAGSALGIGVAALLVLFIAMLQLFGVIDLTTAVGLASATGIIIVALALAYFGYVYVAGGLSGVEKKRLGVIGVLFFFSAIFWSGFEQAGSSLNLFAERLTDRDVLGWEMPAAFLQSVNSIWIITLAPVFAWLWVWLNRRGREPSSPAKFAYGLVFLGFGFLVMVAAASLATELNPVAPGWLILTYLLFTIGELCLSPVGLSTVTKLAPHRMVGQMMGVWFMSISLGNLMAGQVGGLFETLPLPHLFGAVAATTAGAGLVLALFVKPIRRLMGGVH